MNSFLFNQYSYAYMLNSGISNPRGNIFSSKKPWSFNTAGLDFTQQYTMSNYFRLPSFNNGQFIAPNIFRQGLNITYNSNPAFDNNTFTRNLQQNIFGNSIFKRRATHNTEITPPSTTKANKSDKAEKPAKAAKAEAPKKIAEPNKTRPIAKQPPKKTDLRSDFLTTSRRYFGYNEADGSSRAISNSPEWCADFIKFVINKTYREKGLVPPTKDLQIEPGMPHLRVQNIKDWGIAHGTYLSVANRADKAEIIKNKVKPGDVIILRENGASHTGFVTKVYADGSFDSIEGNRNDRVMNAHYSANDPSLSGFVQVQS